MNDNRWEAWFVAVPALFVVLWSTGFIGAKYGLAYAEPLTFLALRFVFVAALLIVLALTMQAPWPDSRAEIGHIALAGLLVHAGYLGGVFSAIYHGVPAAAVALIAGLQPVLTAAAAGPLLGERINARQRIGFVLGFLGVALVVGNRLTLGAGSRPAYLLAFLALGCITADTLYQKRFCGGMDLRSGAVVQFTASAIVMLAAAAFMEDMKIE